MQQFNRAITAMLFAAHAMLGCCAHHACGAWAAADGGPCTFCVENHCADDDGTHEPAEHGERPVAPCDHDTCSFVKIQPLRVDHGGGQVLWVTAERPVVSGHFLAAWPVSEAGEPTSSFDAHLYVRFCALLI